MKLVPSSIHWMSEYGCSMPTDTLKHSKHFQWALTIGCRISTMPGGPS